jgi:xanthine/uracil permease
MPRKPRNVIFGRDERPTVASTTLLALQHAALSILFLVYAVLIAKGAGFDEAQQQALLAGTLVSCGIGAVLQAAYPRFASGLLVLPIGTPVFVAFGIQAGVEAGPGGVATLVLLGGVAQIAMGQLLPKLRAFFPAEVCGVVVLMLGVSILPHGFLRILGAETGGVEIKTDVEALTIGLVTMGSIIAASVWLKGTARFFALLLGCAAGHAVAAIFGELDGFGTAIAAAAFISTPQPVIPTFDVSLPLIAGFLILAIVSAVDDMGVFISMDRMDNADWSRPDMPQTARGISTSGATSIISSLLGGSFLGFSSTNIGLAFATGVTSRIVGIGAGLALIAASFFPKLIAAVGAMPEPVVGGILAYAASFFIVAGAELALSRMLSPRRMIVIGVPVAAGIIVQATPAVAVGTTGLAAIILHSPLMLSALLAIGLNAIMRIGIAQSGHINLSEDTAARHEQITDSINQWGETWGLPRSTVMRAADAVNQLVETVWSLKSGPVTLDARHDDVNVEFRLIYTGQPISVPDRAPTPDEFLNDADGEARMAGWLVRHLTNQLKSYERNGQQNIRLRFDS